MTGKERAKLKSLAAAADTIVQIGKSGITESVKASVDTALTARELVKGKVLESSMLSAREACEQLSEALGAEPVQAIGTKFVLYRRKPEEKASDAKKTIVRKAAAKNMAAGKATPVKPAVKKATTGKAIAHKANTGKAASGKANTAKRAGQAPAARAKKPLRTK